MGFLSQPPLTSWTTRFQSVLHAPPPCGCTQNCYFHTTPPRSPSAGSRCGRKKQGAETNIWKGRGFATEYTKPCEKENGCNDKTSVKTEKKKNCTAVTATKGGNQIYRSNEAAVKLSLETKVHLYAVHEKRWQHLAASCKANVGLYISSVWVTCSLDWPGSTISPRLIFGQFSFLPGCVASTKVLLCSPSKALSRKEEA